MHGTIESLFRVEWRPLGELASLAADWRALAARALEPNVFYEPSFALAAAPVLGRGVGAGLVWSRTTPQRLVGLFPGRIERRRYGAGLPIMVGWTHPYAPLGVPLVDRDAAGAVIAAWLEHLGTQASMPRLMLLPYMTSAGPFWAAFEAALTRRGGTSVAFASHERALLAPGDDRARYLEHAMGRRKRKELGRQIRRLGDAGSVTSSVVSWSTTGDSAPFMAALDDFLRLEADGWKGRAGTAAHGHAELRTFLQTAVPQLAAEGKARIARLFLDERAIAAIIVLQSGDTAWSWKIAYDESVARASPGMQLLLRVTTSLLDDPGVARADSCASANHPMINHVWRERLALSDRLVRVGSGGATAFRLARTIEGARRSAIAAAKRARDLLRR